MTNGKSREILEGLAEIPRWFRMVQARKVFPVALVRLVGIMSIVVSLPCVSVPAAAQDTPLPSFLDTPTPVPEPASPKQIQKAVMRCLSSVDDALGAIRRNPRGLGMAEEGEERYCFDQKKECLKDPSGFACRSFIRDYVPE